MITGRENKKNKKWAHGASFVPLRSPNDRSMNPVKSLDRLNKRNPCVQYASRGTNTRTPRKKHHAHTNTKPACQCVGEVSLTQRKQTKHTHAQAPKTREEEPAHPFHKHSGIFYQERKRFSGQSPSAHSDRRHPHLHGISRLSGFISSRPRPKKILPPNCYRNLSPIT